MTTLIFHSQVHRILGIDLIFFGLILRLYIGRQRFGRANYSLTPYRFYWQYLLDTIHEIILAFAAEALMWLGIYLTVYGCAITLTQILKP